MSWRKGRRAPESRDLFEGSKAGSRASPGRIPLEALVGWRNDQSNERYGPARHPSTSRGFAGVRLDRPRWIAPQRRFARCDRSCIGKRLLRIDIHGVSLSGLAVWSVETRATVRCVLSRPGRRHRTFEPILSGSSETSVESFWADRVWCDDHQVLRKKELVGPCPQWLSPRGVRWCVVPSSSTKTRQNRSWPRRRGANPSLEHKRCIDPGTSLRCGSMRLDIQSVLLRAVETLRMAKRALSSRRNDAADPSQRGEPRQGVTQLSAVLSVPIAAPSPIFADPCPSPFFPTACLGFRCT